MFKFPVNLCYALKARRKERSLNVECDQKTPQEDPETQVQETSQGIPPQEEVTGPEHASGSDQREFFALSERKIAIGSIFVLFFLSVGILTYQEGEISDLTNKLHQAKVRSEAQSGKPLSFSEKTAPSSANGSYELDVYKAASAIPDFQPMLPPEIGQGMTWTLKSRERLHFIGGNLVVLELQNPKGNILPVLFQIPDPGQSITWRYLYGFVPS